MIGVDIVDHSVSFHLNKKHSLSDYMSKIANDREVEYCKNWEDLDLLWAIKESAYKCFFKTTNRYFINPKRIKVIHLDRIDHRFEVEIDEYSLSGLYHQTNGFVYAISRKKGENTPPIATFLFDHYVNKAPLEEELASYSAEKILDSQGYSQGLQTVQGVYPYSRSHHGKYYFSAVLLTPYN